MECQFIQKRLLDYIDGKLSPKASKEITNHLLDCETCEKTYRLYQKTDGVLKGFGEAVRLGIFDMIPPPLPTLQQRPLWVRLWDVLKMPVPVWIPSAVSVAIILVFTMSLFFLLKPSIEKGNLKGVGNTASSKPPLTAEATLEFLIVPDSTDIGQLAASIETVETFLLSHPNDVAMHAKLIELYHARLKLQPLSEVSRASLNKKLSIKQDRFMELLEKLSLTKGIENEK